MEINPQMPAVPHQSDLHTSVPTQTRVAFAPNVQASAVRASSYVAQPAALSLRARVGHATKHFMHSLGTIANALRSRRVPSNPSYAEAVNMNLPAQANAAAQDGAHVHAGGPSNAAPAQQQAAPEIEMSTDGNNTHHAGPVVQALNQLRDATQAMQVSQGSRPSSLPPGPHITSPPTGHVPATATLQAPVVPTAQLPNQGALPNASNANTLHTPRPNVQTVVRINLPPIDKWDGKCKTRRADTFLNDIERYAAMSMQDANDLLMSLLAPDIREQYEQVRRRYVGTMPWDVCRTEFKKMVGDVYERTEESVTRAFIAGEIKQLPEQSVAKYRTYFENQLRIARAMPEYMAVDYFINGLVHELQIRCLGDATGRSFKSLDDVFSFAQNEERKLKREKAVLSKLKRNATALMADDNANLPRNMQRRKRRRHDGNQQFNNGNGNGNGSYNGGNHNNNNRGHNFNRGGHNGRGGYGGYNKFRGGRGYNHNNNNNNNNNSSNAVHNQGMNAMPAVNAMSNAVNATTVCAKCSGFGHTADRCATQ